MNRILNVRRKTFDSLQSKSRSIFSPLFEKHFHTSLLSKNAKEEKVPEDSVPDILEELKEPELSEEEIFQKRFKSRLPEKIFQRHILKEPTTIEFKRDLQQYRLRQYWARFGKSSKMNPGLCWPTRNEILKTIEYDKTFEPPLQDRLQKSQEKRLADLKEKQEYEAEVDRNMANLDKWIEDFNSRNEKKEEKIRELRLKREKLVDEISEYLGYDIDPKDPRFKEAVEQRDKEMKKAQKAKKQQESYEKMLEKLKKIAQQK